ncbi:hypothetical protein LMG31886_06670 [Xanthomonas hydrangeae]|nr:hypothetical protein LMG31886_06670 [Xanthomonas hydrangeae]CAD7724584.1 hypothetical protein LMG31886_06670 [Xanthomonas hydrangeae]CAD7725721.1 hypothetical protein LMG31885_08830 [Xanthomonas hydrangeae]CAD7725725.1 hypothetical protein LMG31885_08830 [Xanthomonas hydrangeae]
MLAICRRNDTHGRPSATAMTLSLIRRGNAQACRQLGTLPEAQLLMPCLFGALNKRSPEDRSDPTKNAGQAGAFGATCDGSSGRLKRHCVTEAGWANEHHRAANA